MIIVPPKLLPISMIFLFSGRRENNSTRSKVNLSLENVSRESEPLGLKDPFSRVSQ